MSLRIWLRYAVIALLCIVAGLCAAQVPGFPMKAPGAGGNKATVAAAPSVIPNDDSQADALAALEAAQVRLREVRDGMSRLQAQLGQPALQAAMRNDLLKQFNVRQELADRYVQQVDYLKQLQVMGQKIDDAKQLRDNWTPPPGNPPWSVIEGDQVRSDMQMLESRIRQLGNESATFSDQLLTLGREKTESETRLRQFQETLEKTDPTRVSDVDRRKLDELKIAVAMKSAQLLRTDLERRVQDKERTLLEIKLETVAKTWNYYDGRFALAPDVLASVKSDIQAGIDRERERELAALRQLEIAMNALSKAQESYKAAEQKNVSPLMLEKLRAALDIAQAKESGARSDVDRLRQLIEIGGYNLQVWESRAEIYQKPPPDAVRLEAIKNRVQMGLLRVRQWRDFIRQTLATNEQEAFDLRESTLSGKSNLDRMVIAAKLQAANLQSDSARSVRAALDKFEQSLALMQAELGIKEKNRSWYERVEDNWYRLRAGVKDIWQYELFTIDDVIVADGREVKTTRGVTVGKSIGVMFLLVFGYFLLSWAIRLVIGFAERVMGLKSSTATQTRRWLMLLATATLIILSFNLVQIPLSVFAFLGGALAIGAGFGTQNLLKNLISGVMLLVERPIRIGDLVEMDGIKGRVTSIGIRFSTILSADGVDTLIPNSELVEKKLINWTYSNPNARREIQVNVAYGTSVVQVKNMLQAIALEHRQISRSPEPVVTLDALGDNGLLFTLRFWVRLDPGVDMRQIDSDLRCDLLEKLTASGIEVPFPQRDVRLKVMAPVAVNVETRPDARQTP